MKDPNYGSEDLRVYILCRPNKIIDLKKEEAIAWGDSYEFKSGTMYAGRQREKNACSKMEYNVKYEHKYQIGGEGT